LHGYQPCKATNRENSKLSMSVSPQAQQDLLWNKKNCWQVQRAWLTLPLFGGQEVNT
jgi:hypothetical protein